ncbi:GNAT family N-acetyltransferase [Dysgonomonas sp. 520]|uniref:GNAT family N-acetyltransferase n=1 Tax=Dysgonomonas sp. 520 TaxID=2302931 RepID=UPI0013D1CFE1|nr:GNAT family N-acetyltransferase [Dysgonomonas sp. 520]NDW09099.1 N-acetyltransferase [Dysgonomonas sp. 520]
MRLVPASVEHKPDLDFIEKLYIESFPANERRPVPELYDLIENEDVFTAFVVLNEDSERIGFLTYWNLDGFVYAEHFAISPEFRNGGNGAKIMISFLNHFTVPVILEVEAPTSETAKRRIGFYERLGFKLWNFDYVQPPYGKDLEPVPMKLMSYREIDLDKNYEEIKTQLYTRVYKVT